MNNKKYLRLFLILVIIMSLSCAKKELNLSYKKFSTKSEDGTVEEGEGLKILDKDGKILLTLVPGVLEHYMLAREIDLTGDGIF